MCGVQPLLVQRVTNLVNRASERLHRVVGPVPRGDAHVA